MSVARLLKCELLRILSNQRPKYLSLIYVTLVLLLGC
jgi:hypothetical protein